MITKDNKKQFILILTKIYNYEKLLTILAIFFACVCLNAQTARVVLSAGDVWDDGSGYQMLLDETASLYGTTIPATGAFSSLCTGNESLYGVFSHKIPQNADGECTTSNIVINNSVAIDIPAGTYDFCITNPTPGDRIWIASANGNIGGRADNYVFAAGNTYTFTVTFDEESGNDRTDVVITTTSLDPPSIDTSVVEPIVLDAPTLISPSNGVVDIDTLGVALTWNDVEDADSYEVILAFATDFSPIEERYTPMVTNQQTDALQPGTQYFWKVRARSDTVTSPWSETWSFTTLARAIEVDPGDTIPSVEPGDGTGIFDATAETLHIYPNPVTDVLNVKAAGYSSVEILNFLGQVVYRSGITNGALQIGTAELPAGVYFLRLRGDNVVTKKFTK